MAPVRCCSIFNVTGCLTPVLLGLPFTLPALRVALLVRCTTFLLGVSGTLACLLADVTPGAALLRLLRRLSRPGRECESDGCY